MATNANVFNSRVTSEALEAKFRQVFPAQAGAELIQDLYASGVIQPVIDFSTVAEGSVLPVQLQTAWDFSTGHQLIQTATPTTLISNTGFWKVDLTWVGQESTVGSSDADVALLINDGSSNKAVWQLNRALLASAGATNAAIEQNFVVFLRAGDSLRGKCMGTGEDALNVWYRQIADVNGNLVNPLGFTFQ